MKSVFDFRKFSSFIWAAPFLCLIVLGIYAFWGTLPGPFIWDDLLLIQRNHYLTDWNFLPEVFTQMTGVGGGGDFHFFRPLTTVSYMLNYAVHGLRVQGYHVVNVLLHILNSIGVYFLIKYFLKARWPALAGGLLFLVHPVQSEVVPYLSERADLLSAFLFLLSFSLYVRSDAPRRIVAGLWSGFFLFLALFAKENIVFFPLLAGAYHYCFSKKMRWINVATTGLVLTGYIVYRVCFGLTVPMPKQVWITLPERLPGFFVAIYQYVMAIIWPVAIHKGYQQQIFSWSHPEAVAGLAIFVCFCFLIFLFKKKSPVVSFSLSWFLITLLPMSNLYPLSAYMYFHWLYVPIIGAALLVGCGIKKMTQIPVVRSVLALCFVALVVNYTGQTKRLNAFWLEPERFYLRVLSYAPRNTGILNNLGAVYYEKKWFVPALEKYQQALTINPQKAKYYFNAAKAYEAIKQYDRAVDYYRRALAIDPEFVEAYNNLGNVYFSIRKPDLALQSYSEAIRVDPEHIKAYINKGNILSRLQHPKEAVRIFVKALLLDPKNAALHNNLAMELRALKQYPQALYHYQQAIEINPGQVESYFNMGNTLVDMGQLSQAAKVYEKVIEMEPGFKGAFYNLAHLYDLLGQKEQADSWRQKAEQLR